MDLRGSLEAAEQNLGRPLTLDEERVVARAYFVLRDYEATMDRVQAMIAMNPDGLERLRQQILAIGRN